MPIIKVNNRDVHIQELNTAAPETILLVHGMCSNLSIYYFRIAPILARHFHVVMYDLKSHGMSEKISSGYDLNSLTDDLVHLMEYLHIASAYLAGYSFGGLICLKMATRFPQRIKKLVLIEAPNPNDDKIRLVMDAYSRESLEHYLNGPNQRKFGNRQMDRKHRLYEHLFHETTIKRDFMQESDFFIDTEIAQIKQETLLLYGSYSPCLEAGENLKEKISSAALFALNGDHDIPLQEPERIGNMMEMFFKNQMAQTYS
ncbi:Pimeloyl-ACP methyl ester carboxylesterase [Pedobacter westerhofensis]|uniref:Pimeloyl-ACP methyl ester carboxylesterase n=1 Tax=Pedobacter westerhofensis TaxID=425512 RepID=A0A521E852_9SPHI|nr:alpha/beta fold hydrolase [Pedobacter westerhofensis]SMO79350.1 Pimeloyl-ACP methyl ester carboxylesterase [Pedobacter westerhofensis]